MVLPLALVEHMASRTATNVNVAISQSAGFCRWHEVECNASLLDYLFTSGTDISDPLEFADEQLAAASGHPLFKRIARIAQRNIRAATITAPVTGCEIDAETAAVSVMARGLATMLGEAMPRDAAEEMAAAWG